MQQSAGSMTYLISGMKLQFGASLFFLVFHPLDSFLSSIFLILIVSVMAALVKNVVQQWNYHKSPSSSPPLIDLCDVRIQLPRCLSYSDTMPLLRFDFLDLRQEAKIHRTGLQAPVLQSDLRRKEREWCKFGGMRPRWVSFDRETSIYWILLGRAWKVRAAAAPDAKSANVMT